MVESQYFCPSPSCGFSVAIAIHLLMFFPDQSLVVSGKPHAINQPQHHLPSGKLTLRY